MIGIPFEKWKVQKKCIHNSIQSCLIIQNQTPLAKKFVRNHKTKISFLNKKNQSETSSRTVNRQKKWGVINHTRNISLSNKNIFSQKNPFWRNSV